MVNRYEEIIEEIVEDLELQARFKLTERQILTLHRTQQIRFKKGELDADAVAGIESYLHDTLPEERVWDCYESLSDSSLVIAIRLGEHYVTLMLM